MDWILSYSHNQLPNNSLMSPFFFVMAIYHTGGVFFYLPYHLDLALEDSVGHSTCMSVLARRRAIMGSGLGLGYHGVVGGFLALPYICPTGVGIPLYPWQHLDRTVWAARYPMIALRRANTLMHVL